MTIGTKKESAVVRVLAASSSPDIALSRRACLAGAALIGVGAAVALTGEARAQAKMSQADAKYQDTPKGQDKCSGCALFKAPDACQSVDGKISPEGWCSLYSPKA